MLKKRAHRWRKGEVGGGPVWGAPCTQRGVRGPPAEADGQVRGRSVALSPGRTQHAAPAGSGGKGRRPHGRGRGGRGDKARTTKPPVAMVWTHLCSERSVGTSPSSEQRPGSLGRRARGRFYGRRGHGPGTQAAPPVTRTHGRAIHVCSHARHAASRRGPPRTHGTRAPPSATACVRSALQPQDRKPGRASAPGTGRQTSAAREAHRFFSESRSAETAS